MTSLTLADRIRMTWWRVIKFVHHCPDCKRRGYDPFTPRWDEDRVALSLGWVTPDRCGGCGR